MTDIKILKIIDYTIPMYGNKRIFPYGYIEVSNGTDTKVVKFDKDNKWLRFSFTFNRKRYFMENIGGLYNPKFIIKESD